jgi:hypothetical protein
MVGLYVPQTCLCGMGWEKQIVIWANNWYQELGFLSPIYPPLSRTFPGSGARSFPDLRRLPPDPLPRWRSCSSLLSSLRGVRRVRRRKQVARGASRARMEKASASSGLQRATLAERSAQRTRRRASARSRQPSSAWARADTKEVVNL